MEGSNAAVVAGALRRFADTFFQREVFRGLDSWARQTSNALRRQCPSREAKGTISGKAQMGPRGPVAHVQCASQIGQFMEYGTGVHGPKGKPIRAKGGSYEAATGGRRTRALLRWKTDRTSYTDRHGKVRKIRGGYMYAPEVQGSRPNPWFFPTLERMLTTVRAHIANAVQRAMTRAFAGVRGARMLTSRTPALPMLPPVRRKGKR